ncbi:hypothetical protein LTR53_011761 [Teratosphaeriaceae sp. CCFEE 6253]|nr:hypothetical protein LTR53_011761 [Teratosphaeriaceae sp. CCFEE 6253]
MADISASQPADERTSLIPEHEDDRDEPRNGDLERTLLRKVDLRLTTIAGVLCSLNLLDSGVISSASVTSMPSDLDLTGNRFSVSIFIFTIASITFQLPSTIAVRRFGPRRWFSFITFCFGLITICTAFIRTWKEMIAMRILLGMAMSGVYPGLSYLISTWYLRSEQQTRYAYMQTGQVIILATGSIVNFSLNKLDGRGGLAGWRYMFLVQGLLTLLIGIVTYFWMVDFPDQAHNTPWFLTEEEQKLAVSRIQLDRRDAQAEPFAWSKVLRHAKDPKVYGFACMFFLLNLVSTSLSYFTPIILRSGMGFGENASILLSAPPYYYAIIPVILSSVLGDRYRIRGPIIVFNCLCLTLGFCMLGFVQQVTVRYLGVFLATGAYISNWAAFSAYYQGNIAGQWKRVFTAAAVTAMNGAGGIAGSFIVRRSEAPWYPSAVWISIGSHVLIIAFVMAFSAWFAVANRRQSAGKAVLEATEGFRYTLLTLTEELSMNQSSRTEDLETRFQALQERIQQLEGNAQRAVDSTGARRLQVFVDDDCIIQIPGVPRRAIEDGGAAIARERIGTTAGREAAPTDGLRSGRPALGSLPRQQESDLNITPRPPQQQESDLNITPRPPQQQDRNENNAEQAPEELPGPSVIQKQQPLRRASHDRGAQSNKPSREAQPDVANATHEPRDHPLLGPPPARSSRKHQRPAFSSKVLKKPTGPTQEGDPDDVPDQLPRRRSRDRSRSPAYTASSTAEQHSLAHMPEGTFQAGKRPVAKRQGHHSRPGTAANEDLGDHGVPNRPTRQAGATDVGSHSDDARATDAEDNRLSEIGTNVEAHDGPGPPHSLQDVRKKSRSAGAFVREPILPAQNDRGDVGHEGNLVSGPRKRKKTQRYNGDDLAQPPPQPAAARKPSTRAATISVPPAESEKRKRPAGGKKVKKATPGPDAIAVSTKKAAKTGARGPNLPAQPQASQDADQSGSEPEDALEPAPGSVITRAKAPARSKPPVGTESAAKPRINSAPAVPSGSSSRQDLSVREDSSTLTRLKKLRMGELRRTHDRAAARVPPHEDDEYATDDADDESEGEAGIPEQAPPVTKRGGFRLRDSGDPYSSSRAPGRPSGASATRRSSKNKVSRNTGETQGAGGHEKDDSLSPFATVSPPDVKVKVRSSEVSQEGEDGSEAGKIKDEDEEDELDDVAAKTQTHARRRLAAQSAAMQSQDITVAREVKSAEKRKRPSETTGPQVPSSRRTGRRGGDFESPPKKARTSSSSSLSSIISPSLNDSADYRRQSLGKSVSDDDIEEQEEEEKEEVEEEEEEEEEGVVEREIGLDSALAAADAAREARRGSAREETLWALPLTAMPQGNRVATDGDSGIQGRGVDELGETLGSVPPAKETGKIGKKRWGFNSFAGNKYGL